jgi:hypothetical protein
MLSVLAGARARLPGWALGSPLVYELARAGLIVLGLTVIANLLLALASGRLVSKMSAQGGLELDTAALVAESGDADRETAAALRTLNQRIDALERTHEGAVASIVGTIGHVNARLEVLTQALAASGGPAPAPNEERDEGTPPE